MAGLPAVMVLILTVMVSDVEGGPSLLDGIGRSLRRPPPAGRRSPPPRAAVQTVFARAQSRADCAVAAGLMSQLPVVRKQALDKGTMFLPNDGAFADYARALGLNASSLLGLDMELLTALLLHHIVPGLAVHTPKPGSAPQRLVTALPGTEVTLAREGSAVWVGSAADRARVVAADLSAGKGLVHVIDRVLPPFDILRPPPDPPLPRPRTLREALVALGLPSTVGAMEEAAGLGPLLDQRGLAGTTGTLFAPTEEAWERMQDQLAPAEALLTSSKEAVKLLLGEHVHLEEALDARLLATRKLLPVGWAPAAYMAPSASALQVRFSGSQLTLAGYTTGTVVQSGTFVAGGKVIVHVVNSVLLSNETARQLGLGAEPPQQPPPAGPGSIPPKEATNSTTQALMAVLQATPDLSSLAAAAVQAEMPRLLPRLEPTLTLFAPTNDAFAALRAAEADAGDTDDAMMLVLSFHVHLGVTPVPLSSLSEGQLLLVGVEYKLYGEPGHKQLVVTVNASGAFVSLDHVTARVVGSLTYGGSVVNLIDRVLLTDALAARLLRRPPPPPPVDGAKGVPGAPEQPSAAGEGAPPPAPWPPQPGTPPGLDGPEVVFANQQYGNLTQALAGLGDTGTMLALYNAVAESVVGGILRGVLSGSFTLFCPTDQAFAAFLARTQRTLAEVLAVDKDPVAVARVILPHILLYRAVPPEELTPGRNLTTGMVGVLQTQLTVARSGDRIAILGPGTSVVHVLRTGITSGAAQVHVIDGVIELKA